MGGGVSGPLYHKKLKFLHRIVTDDGSVPGNMPNSETITSTILPSYLKKNTRGTASVSISGYYRSTGAYFSECIDLPIELIDNKVD